MPNWFTCKLCIEKEKLISVLIKQNKDLHDRLMSFNERQFLNFKAEERSTKPLYPYGIDSKGKPIDYQNINIKESQEEIFRALGEDPLTVEEPISKEG